MVMPGSVLIQRDALPVAAPCLRCFQVDATCPHDWLSARHDLNPGELENELAAAGWRFIHRSPLRTMVFGFNRTRMIQVALKRIIAMVRRQRCNCLEVDDLTTRSFLGVRFVSISARVRHLQPDAALQVRSIDAQARTGRAYGNPRPGELEPR